MIAAGWAAPVEANANRDANSELVEDDWAERALAEDERGIASEGERSGGFCWGRGARL